MRRVTAFVGTASKKATYQAVRQFLEQLQARGDVEVEIVRLSEYHLEPCLGCKQCFIRGEEHCPLRDDRDLLLAKLKASDGVVFATPNYSFQVSALLKLFLDRLGYSFHRPEYCGKTFSSIVVQGFYGARKIERYLNFVGTGLGFTTVKGSCITALEPMGEKERQAMTRTLERQAARFHERLVAPAYPSPSLLMLLGFRNGRTCVRLECGERDRDYQVYQAKGWLESDFWYPVKLGPVKRALGGFVDWLAARRYGAKRLGPGAECAPDQPGNL